MKKLLFLSACLICLSNINAIAQDGLGEEELHANVLTMKQRCYDVLIVSKTVQKGDMTYCAAGNENHVFDMKGRRVETSGYDVAERLEWRAIYKYKPENNECEMTVYNAQGDMQTKTLFKYSPNGSLLEEHIYDAEGVFVEKHIHKYDVRGLNRLTTSCYQHDEDLRWKEKYEYNHLEQKVEYKHYDAMKNLDWLTVYKYDYTGFKTEEITYDANNNELSHYLYEYVYDDLKNWIRQTTYSYDTIKKERIPESIIERDIVYY
jgi:hypothetical protein